MRGELMKKTQSGMLGQFRLKLGCGIQKHANKNAKTARERLLALILLIDKFDGVKRLCVEG